MNQGEDEGQISVNFRKVAKSYTELFRTQRDHVHQLLHGAHNHSSGLFRESLIRHFLETILPRAVSVDSGFIYGFDQVPSSKQIDILVWDSMRHSAVYRTRKFVIVPQEAVIAAISVKSSLQKKDIVSALDNLLSITPLELMYRSAINQRQPSQPVFPPITKIIVSFRGPSNVDRARDTVAQFFVEHFASDKVLAMEMLNAFRNIDPIQPANNHVYQVERVIPKLIASIGSNEC